MSHTDHSPTQYKDYVICSADRHAGQNESDFTVPVLTDGFIFEASLTNATIHNTIYNVETGKNDLIKWRDGLDGSWVIPEGNYTVDDLIAEITSQGLGSWTVTYSDITGKISFASSSSSYQLDFRPANAMWDVLGFEPELYNSPGPITSGKPVYMDKYTHMIYMQISEFGNHGKSTSGLNGYTYKVPVGERGSVTHFHEMHDRSSQLVRFTPTGINNLSVRLKDSRGKILRVNSDWEMTIKMKKTLKR